MVSDISNSASSEASFGNRPTVGLLGLGNMGDAVASRLAQRFQVLAYDPDTARCESAARTHGITTVATPEDVRADIVVLSLPRPQISLDMIDVVTQTGVQNGLVIETSTVNPSDAQRMHQRALSRSWSFIDAAILSGVGQMYQGTATLLVGGTQNDLDRAEPVLSALSTTQRRFGGVGTGMAAKVINNAVAHAVMVVLVEAGALAVASGLKSGDIPDLLMGPDAGLTRPLTHRYVERILRADYEGGMPTEAARKDSVLALELAQQSGVPLFAIQGAHSAYEIAVGNGLGRSDYSSIAQLWQEWTGRSMTDSAIQSADPMEGQQQ